MVPLRAARSRFRQSRSLFLQGCAGSRLQGVHRPRERDRPHHPFGGLAQAGRGRQLERGVQDGMSPEEHAILSCYFPHPEVPEGELILEDLSMMISPMARIDLTGSVTIGPLSMNGEGTIILTHDHFHEGRRPLLEVQKERGVKWQDKRIGRDVWLHGCTVLYQVSEIPDGVVVGAGAVLTRNPEPYGIYAGNPAR